MRTQDHLFRKLLLGTAPLLVWAGHFFFCYAYAAAACLRNWPGRERVLLLATVMAVGAGIWLLWRALRAASRKAGPGVRAGSLLDWARIGGAVLALTGMLWTSVPLMMLALCR